MVIADSNAVLMASRVFPQHQAALGLIKQLVQDPRKKKINWLDLACGRGQILANIENIISSSRLDKITYFGFDVSHDGFVQIVGQACVHK